MQLIDFCQKIFQSEGLVVVVVIAVIITIPVFDVNDIIIVVLVGYFPASLPNHIDGFTVRLLLLLLLVVVVVVVVNIIIIIIIIIVVFVGLVEFIENAQSVDRIKKSYAVVVAVDVVIVIE